MGTTPTGISRVQAIAALMVACQKGGVPPEFALMSFVTLGVTDEELGQARSLIAEISGGRQ